MLLIRLAHKIKRSNYINKFQIEIKFAISGSTFLKVKLDHF